MNDTQVQIDWNLPDDGGSNITYYNITIETSAGIFDTDLTECDGSDTAIIQARSCKVSYDTLTNAPFNLQGNDQVNATVAAINTFGVSNISAVGNGAVIPTTPGAPTDLEQDEDQTTRHEIYFSWSAPADTGGIPILNYSVMRYYEEEDKFESYANVTETSATVIDLAKNTNYTFKVSANNQLGSGDYSLAKQMKTNGSFGDLAP